MPRAKKPPALGVNTGNNEKIPEPTGRAYGARKATREAVAAVPTAGPSVPPVAPAAAPAPVDNQAALAAAQNYQMDGPQLTDPSANPHEPITAGLPTGPGPGPEILGLPSDAASTAALLRTMYVNVPEAHNSDFLRLVELAERQAL